MMSCSWQSPKEKVFLERFYLSKGEKMNKLNSILEYLQKEQFIFVDNKKELFSGIKELPLLVLGAPAFCFMNVFPQSGGLGLQISSKVDIFAPMDYMHVDSEDELICRFKMRRSAGLHLQRIDLERGTIVEEHSRSAANSQTPSISVWTS